MSQELQILRVLNLVKTGIIKPPPTYSDASVMMLTVRATRNLNWEWYVPFLSLKGLIMEMQLRGMPPMSGYTMCLTAVIMYSALDYILRTAEDRGLPPDEVQRIKTQKKNLQSNEDYRRKTIEDVIVNAFVRVHEKHRDWIVIPDDAEI